MQDGSDRLTTEEERTCIERNSPGASFMLGVLTGAFVGAGVALLFAPKSGQETRQQLGEQYRGLADRVGETRRRTGAARRPSGASRAVSALQQLGEPAVRPGFVGSRSAGGQSDERRGLPLVRSELCNGEPRPTTLRSVTC